MVPVGAFLAGKLVSHTLLGALLGLFGEVLQPSPRARAVMLIVAGLLMVLFALDLFGVKAVQRLVPRPPAAFGRVLRRSAKTGSAVTPALIGFATVLVPCGVTLSVELVAVTSGSPMGGAAVMAGFVIGTAPLFAVLGYLFRRTSQAWSGRLAAVTGVVVLATAAWTVVSGLQAGGWASFSLSGAPAAQAAGESSDAVQELPAVQGPGLADTAKKQRIVVTVTWTYSPAKIVAKAGVPTTLVVRSKDASGCARAFTIPELGIEEFVQENGDLELDLGVRKPGTLRFSCAMGMAGGAIRFTGGRQ